MGKTMNSRLHARAEHSQPMYMQDRHEEAEMVIFSYQGLAEAGKEEHHRLGEKGKIETIRRKR